MRYFLFSKAYFAGLLPCLNVVAFATNTGLLLGILILLLTLVLLLLVLIIKAFNLNKNNDSLDNRDDLNKSKEERILIPDVANGNFDETKADIVSYGNKVISINEDLKPFGFAYDLDNRDFYSIMSPWQRQFGYCSIYDETAPALSLIFDSEPIKFDYNGKHWLIQFWKGQYGITTGAEIGVYNTKDDDLNIAGIFSGRFYHAVGDEERLEMGFSLVKNDELLSSRKALHWWLTSFILGEFSYPNELIMYIEISFPTLSMRDAFLRGLRQVGYRDNDYSINDNTVYVVFDTPYSKQPYTKTSFTEEIMQENNVRNVDFFNKATNSFTDVIDKLYLLRQESPDYFKDVLKIGKPRKLYDIYSSIKKYLD